MSDTGRNETEGFTAAEVDDGEDDPDSQPEISRVSSASARYSTSEKSQYAPGSHPSECQR